MPQTERTLLTQPLIRRAASCCARQDAPACSRPGELLCVQNDGERRSDLPDFCSEFSHICQLPCGCLLCLTHWLSSLSKTQAKTQELV